ncbi:hypothetical protein RRG08_067136 [Elysia crispata]|uniref:Uncharacterized protein n=1 Tax=Elysia crispata TaxID=231223 RepID=A0AAE0ZIL1_9GAST|nr:hypothetical protein RRG08_067136 [Elysia crispata]
MQKETRDMQKNTDMQNEFSRPNLSPPHFLLLPSFCSSLKKSLGKNPTNRHLTQSITKLEGSGGLNPAPLASRVEQGEVIMFWLPLLWCARVAIRAWHGSSRTGRSVSGSRSKVEGREIHLYSCFRLKELVPREMLLRK